MSCGMQVRAIPPITVTAQIHFHPEDPNGKNPRPYPREATAPRMKNGPVKRQWTRPHREALSRHSVPMKPRDAVHKTVLQTGDTAQPRANANHGRHQKRKPLIPLHSRSRFGPHELASADCMTWKVNLPLFEFARVLVRFDQVAGRCDFIRLVCGFRDGADVANPQISTPARSDWPGNAGPSGQSLPPARSRERSSTLPLHYRLRPSR